MFFDFIIDKSKNIFKKIINALLKNYLKKILNKYLIEKNNLFVKTDINNGDIYFKIYNLELMIPPINNINMVRFDIYQVILVFSISEFKLKKTIINGINILYNVFESNQSKYKLFDSFEKSCNNVELKSKNQIYQKGIDLIDFIITKKINEITIYICNVKLIDLTNQITTNIPKIIFKICKKQINILNTSIYKAEKIILSIKKIKLICNDELNKFKFAIPLIKLYISKETQLIDIIKIVDLYINKTETENKINLDIFFKKISLKYYLNNTEYIYINFFLISVDKEKLIIPKIDIFLIKYKDNISLYRVFEIKNFKILKNKNIKFNIEKIFINIYSSIFIECSNIVNDINNIIEHININQSEDNKNHEKKDDKYINIEDDIIDNYLTNYVNLSSTLDNHSICSEINKVYQENDFVLVEDYSIVEQKNRSSDISINIELINIMLYDKLSHNENVNIKIENINLNTIFDKYENKYIFNITNLNIIDNLKISNWYKLLYQEENNYPFIEIILIEKHIDGNHQYNLQCYLNKLIFNIDQDTIYYLHNIYKSNLFYNLSCSNKKKKELYFNNILINEIKLNISYKPKNIDLSSLFSGEKKELLNLNVIHDLNLELKKIKLQHVSGISLIIHSIFDIWASDIQENKLLKCLLTIGPTKYVYNIGGDLYKIFNNFNDEEPYINKITSIHSSSKNLVHTITDQILEFTTRTLVSTQTAIEKINYSELDNEESKFKNAPTSIKKGLYQSCNSIKKSYEKIFDSNLSYSDRLLQPIVGITEATSKSLMGIHYTLNKEKAKINKNRYN